MNLDEDTERLKKLPPYLRDVALLGIDSYLQALNHAKEAMNMAIDELLKSMQQKFREVSKDSNENH